MGSKFTVDLDQLDQIVSRLNGLAGFLRDHLDELDRRAKALGNGSWESAAATAYAEAHTQWLAAAREFAEGVAAMSDAAQKAHGRYTRAIEVNRRMLQSGQP
ncbi:WXG100 family type VII secretion target [Nocardia transvalensis]|uniref:WXG100 family type VII secretion target n=1 Tax=Nocardia transvalensis TaxID=37333 RepID=UPI0018952DB6|nr:WXG100 family type VII secretion target [Nocardia transvalensis]MBF6327562.1 WXG100 family type VII secretion target [Nocardia transvalensis]